MIPDSYVLNGDKPFINVEAKIVYGSPWCGKERMGVNTAVPLKGIVALERGRGNSIEPVAFHNMLPALLRQAYVPEDRSLALKAYRLIGQLSDVPCWRLRCNTNLESAMVAYNALVGHKEHRPEGFSQINNDK